MCTSRGVPLKRVHVERVMLKLQRRLFSMGKPYMVEEWELMCRVIDVGKKKPDAPVERFSKSFQEYLNTRLTLDEIMKKKKELNNKNDNTEPVCNP
jgi:hypothetical protein